MINSILSYGWSDLCIMTASVVTTSNVAQKYRHNVSVLMLTLLLMVQCSNGSHGANELLGGPDPSDATYNATRITVDQQQQQRRSPMNGVQSFHYGKKATELGCRELRSKRYISDGLCATIRPISEVVCANWCIMPAFPQPGLLPGYLQESDWRAFMRRQRMLQKQGTNNNVTDDYPVLEKWRCVDGATKRRRVKLLCRDGSRRTYHVKVVKKCKCTKKHDSTKVRHGQESNDAAEAF